jgi:hypothetical protein
VAQVILRWVTQRDIVVIPKSVKKERMAENFDIFGFDLDTADMKAIAALETGQSLFFDHRDPAMVKFLSEASRVKKSLFKGPRSGGFGLVRDLHDLFLWVTEAHLGWMILLQAAQALRDKGLIAACTKLGAETEGQRSWLQTRIKQAAPQALLVDV